MRFETSLILSTLGALASATYKKSWKPPTGPTDEDWPEFLANGLICDHPVDRMLDENVDPNKLFNSAASTGDPWEDDNFYSTDLQQFACRREMYSYFQDWYDCNSYDSAFRNPKWRISDVYDSYYSMWGHKGIDFNDDIQGSLGHNWIPAAASCLTPERIRKLFITDKLNNAGVYSVTLHMMGIPVTVTVDDLLTFDHQTDQDLVYAKVSSDNKALWLPILEKAAAKLYGNYEMLSKGEMGLAIQTLTGSPFFEAKHIDMHIDDFWDWINKKMNDDWIITAGSLRYKQAYTMLGTETLSNGQRLLRMHNPWGEERFSGPFNGFDDYLTAALKEELEQMQGSDGMRYLTLEYYYYSSFQRTTASPNIDDWHASHYAAFDVPPFDLTEDWAQTITISSDVDQLVYISAYKWYNQPVHDVFCYEKGAEKNSLFMTHDRSDKEYHLKQYHQAHAEGVQMKAGESFNIKFHAQWAEKDLTPRYYSIVAQAEKAPVSLIAKLNHGRRDFENFTIDESTKIYDKGAPLPAYKTCVTRSCNHLYHYKQDGDLKEFEVNMSVVSNNTMHFSMRARSEGIDTEFDIIYNDDNDITVNWQCPGKDDLIFSKQGTDEFMNWFRCEPDNASSYWTHFETNISGGRRDFKDGEDFEVIWETIDEIARYRIAWNTKETTVTTEWYPEGRAVGPHGGEVWDWRQSGIQWGPSHDSLQASALSLKEKTTAAELANKRISTGVYAGVSVAAATLFACVFMAKRKDVSDNFERA